VRGIVGVLERVFRETGRGGLSDSMRGFVRVAGGAKIQHVRGDQERVRGAETIDGGISGA